MLKRIVYIEYDKDTNVITRVACDGSPVPIQNRDYIRGYYDLEDVIKRFHPDKKTTKDLIDNAVYVYSGEYAGFEGRENKKDIW